MARAEFDCGLVEHRGRDDRTKRDVAYWREHLLHAQPPNGFARVTRFPRPLVVPPSVPPFDNLELDQASAGLPFTEPREYGLRFAPVDDVDSTGFALVIGEVGRAFEVFERNPDPAGDPGHRRLQRPRPEAQPPEDLLIDRYYGLRVTNAPALVEHTQGTVSAFEEWSISWFEAHADATYTINVFNSIAQVLNDLAGDLGPAQHLANLAARSLQIRLT